MQDVVIGNEPSPCIHESPGLDPRIHAPLACFVWREPFWHHFPGDSTNQHVEDTVQAIVVAAGRTSVAHPDNRWKNGFEHGPDFIGQLLRDVLSSMSAFNLYRMTHGILGASFGDNSGQPRGSGDDSTVV